MSFSFRRRRAEGEIFFLGVCFACRCRFAAAGRRGRFSFFLGVCFAGRLRLAAAGRRGRFSFWACAWRVVFGSPSPGRGGDFIFGRSFCVSFSFRRRRAQGDILFLGVCFASRVRLAAAGQKGRFSVWGVCFAFSRRSPGVRQAFARRSPGVCQALARRSPGVRQAFGRRSPGFRQTLARRSRVSDPAPECVPERAVERSGALCKRSKTLSGASELSRIRSVARAGLLRSTLSDAIWRALAYAPERAVERALERARDCAPEVRSGSPSGAPSGARSGTRSGERFGERSGERSGKRSGALRVRPATPVQQCLAMFLAISNKQMAMSGNVRWQCPQNPAIFVVVALLPRNTP